MKYDYLIVGAGLYGSVFAREMTDSGKKCLVIDKRKHIGGNCYTEKIDDINIHKYGPHIFHTDNNNVWDYINKFTEFNHYVNRPKVMCDEKIYSFPINLMTLYQMFGVKTPEDAKRVLEEQKIKIENPINFEEKALSEIGEKLYKTFIYGYTKKQWNTEPKNLPEFIFKRLPIRLDFDDNYFNDRYQGIPIGGYTQIFDKLLDNIELKTETNYLDDTNYFNSIADKILYTGKIDELYDYMFGELEYRSLEFQNEILSIEDYQGNALINYTDINVEYTRIIEHKHFEFNKCKNTIITREYPKNHIKNMNDAYYPINDEKNNNIYQSYKSVSEFNNKIIFGGRLAEYKYYDMDDTISSCLDLVQKIK